MPSAAALLNAADRLYSSRVRRVGRSIPYGQLPRQTLDVWAQPGAGPAPVLVFWYGGGWASGRKQDYGFVARALAACGFVVVLPDYRLVPEAHFPDFVEDGARALRWVEHNIAEFGGDPGRVGVCGHSAGAHTAILLALDHRYLRVTGARDGLIRAAAGLAGPYDFLPLSGPLVRAAMGRVRNPAATQPVTFVRADAPPLLLATGSADRLVSPRNARVLVERIVQAGGRAELREYAGRNHVGPLIALSRPFRRRAPVLDDLCAFFHETLA